MDLPLRQKPPSESKQRKGFVAKLTGQVDMGPSGEAEKENTTCLPNGSSVPYHKSRSIDPGIVHRLGTLAAKINEWEYQPVSNTKLMSVNREKGKMPAIKHPPVQGSSGFRSSTINKIAVPTNTRCFVTPQSKETPKGPPQYQTDKIDPFKRSANSDVSDNGPPLSVSKRVAQFSLPPVSCKDPAEWTLAERRALFEKNKEQPLTPKVTTWFTGSVPFRPEVVSVAQTPNPTCVPKSQIHGLAVSRREMTGQPLSVTKTGNMYPCLSDIEIITENESDGSDEHVEERQSDLSCISGEDVGDTSVSQDLDSSFTVEILRRAGLSQFINTPKRKIQLNKQALLCSIVEHATSTRVSDEDSDTDGDIDDLLNEALAQPEENTPPKQLEKDGNPRRDSIEANGLYHSVSSYRKQQQDQCLTPARQLVRNPEVKPSFWTDISCGGYEIPIQQQIRTLQEEIGAQQNVITQAKQALHLCHATVEFSGSTEEVEAEGLLLVASQKKQAAMNEIQRLETEAAMKISSGKLAFRGVLSLSNLSLPLKKDFIGMLAKGGDDFVHYFILLIRSRGQIIPLQMLSTVDGVQDEALRFPNSVQLQDMPPDFQIAVEVYALQTRKEKLNHETKYHISKKSSTFRFTLKKSNDKQGSRLLSKLPAGSPSGSGVVRTSSFGLVGFTAITPGSLRRQNWVLDKVPTTSPIDGTLQLKIQFHTDSLVEERGFLTVFEDVACFGVWHRRWCVLSNDQLLFWKYPDNEKRKEPSSIINLRECVTEHVDAGSLDRAGRNTFLLVTVRQPHKDDKDSLVMTTCSHSTEMRHEISAETKEERTIWCAKINEALANLRAWDTPAQEATGNSVQSVA